jgi:hypothetical protein
MEKKKRAGGSRTCSHAVPRFSANTQKIFFFNFFLLVKIYEEEDLPRVPDDECRNIK